MQAAYSRCVAALVGRKSIGPDRPGQPSGGDRRGDRAERGVAWHDGQDMCLFAKRLERRSVWPSTAPRDGTDRTVTITPAQLGYLLEGIDWRLPQRTWRSQAAG
jgi:transposase